MFVVFEFFMFQFSLEIGAVSLFLILATFCIGFVLNKITTVVEHPSLVLSAEPFRDSLKHVKNQTKSDKEKKAGPVSLIPGIDSSIFEQFRKKFNLKQPESVVEEDITVSVNLPNSNSASQAYEKAGIPGEPENFDEELEDVDQVKVTLSENVKILNELKGEKVDEDSIVNSPENSEIPDSVVVENKKEMGAGEEALEILTQKHQALKKQNEDELSRDQSEEEDDLFSDELIPLPRGEILIEEEKEEIIEEDIFPTPVENESHEDEEGLELSLRESIPHGEKYDEVEGLLKLATTACEAGRIEEAKAGLKSYFNLLNDLGQSPSKNVMQLAEKLEINFDSPSYQAPNTGTEGIGDGPYKKSEKEIHKEPEKTDYSSVMDGIVKTLEKKEAYDEALPLLKDLLKFNRERVNISAMDPLFERI